MLRRLGFFIAWLAPLWSLTCDASGASYVQKHLFIQNCDEKVDKTGYWKALREAATRSIHFESVVCVETEADVSRSIDGILSSMPAPGEGRVALVRSLREFTNTDAEFARAVRAGAILFTFLETDPFQSESNNVMVEDHLVLNFASGSASGGVVGGALIGKEWCRIAGNIPQRVAVYYSYKTALDDRVDKALEEFAAACPGTKLDVSHRLRGNLTEAAAQMIFEKLFLVDKAITTVVCVNDNSAVGVIKAADKLLSANRARSLIVTGYGHRDVGIPYLNSKRLAVTVNEQIAMPNKGVWDVMPKVRGASFSDMHMPSALFEARSI